MSYSELARRRGVRLEIAELAIDEQRLGPERGELFGLDPDTPATTFTRVLLMDGQPGARMRDVVHPEVDAALPRRACARRSSAARWCSTCCWARACRWPTRART